LDSVKVTVTSTCPQSNDSFSRTASFSLHTKHSKTSKNRLPYSIKLLKSFQLRRIPSFFKDRHINHITIMFRYQPARALERLTRTTRPSTVAPRFFTTTSTRFPQKDAQDKDSLAPQSTEYSKSGSDDDAASSDAAFNPNKTSPEEAEATAEKEAGGKDNSLNTSPANQEVSEPNDPNAGGTGAPEKKQSGAGSAPKSGGSGSG
jgi:hypothetical protein